MAKIPTTDRKFYDTGKKISTLSAYSGALIPAGQQLQETIKEQQIIKIDALGVEARMRMTDATNEWRLANQSNPNDPNALQDLQNQYDSILSEYRGQIDPLYRGQWDIAGNKLKGAFDMQNQTWAYQQRQENAKMDIVTTAENFYKLAFNHGQNGDTNSAIADYETSYNKLLDYGAKNLGAKEAAYLLRNYQSKFAKSYIAGIADKNPQEALRALDNDMIKDALGEDGVSMARKIVKGEIAKVNLQNKINRYNAEIGLSSKLEGMNVFEAMDYVENHKDEYSDKFYKATMKQLETQAGVNAETQADTYTDLLTQISSIDKSLKAEEVVNQSNDVLENIEEAYAQKRLKLSDRKRLLASLNKIEGKELPQLIKDKSGWYMPYDYNDAKEDFGNILTNAGLTSQAMLEYHKTLANNEENGLYLNGKQKKSLVKDIANKYNQNSLNGLSKADGENWQSFRGD